MNKKIKNVVIVINIIMIILSIYWFSLNQETEPVIVFLGQISTIILIVFENRIAKNLVKKISESDVEIATSKDDSATIKVEEVSNSSKIKIDRRN